MDHGLRFCSPLTHKISLVFRAFGRGRDRTPALWSGGAGRIRTCIDGALVSRSRQDRGDVLCRCIPGGLAPIPLCHGPAFLGAIPNMFYTCMLVTADAALREVAHSALLAGIVSNGKLTNANKWSGC